MPVSRNSVGCALIGRWLLHDRISKPGAKACATTGSARAPARASDRAPRRRRVGLRPECRSRHPLSGREPRRPRRAGGPPDCSASVDDYGDITICCLGMTEAAPLKPLIWVRSSRADFGAFPEAVKDRMGYALY